MGALDFMMRLSMVQMQVNFVAFWQLQRCFGVSVSVVIKWLFGKEVKVKNTFAFFNRSRVGALQALMKHWTC